MVDSPASELPLGPLASKRRTFLIGAASTTILSLLPEVLRPAAAWAGSPADYPEYPYPTTKLGAYDEPYRGQFHFSTRTGWENDINAPLYYRGVYHMFYQHNPHGLVWDTMHWGHATSPDLVHWTQQPIALEPGVQPGNLWSGAGVVDKGNVTGLKSGHDDPIVVFTGTGGVLMNYSTDGAKTFTSYANGRVVAAPPAGSTDSRDPKVLWDEARKRWVMVFWSNEGGNGYDFYTSDNLLDWTYASRFTADWAFECPDFYPMRVNGGSTVKWVLNAASTKYVVGDFDGTRFTTDWTAPMQFDQGTNAYAGQVFNDTPDGRIVQMAWQQGNFGSVWTGNMTFPTELKLVSFPEGLRVTRTPITELDLLRGQRRSWSDRTITGDPGSNPLADVRGETYEIVAEFDTTNATATEFGVKLHTSADGDCNSVVTYDRTRQTLRGVPLTPDEGRIRIHILADRGQLEIYGNDGKVSFSDNVGFDPMPRSAGVAVYAEGGRVRLVSLQYNEIRRAWPAYTPLTNPGSNLTGPWHAVGGSWTPVEDGNSAAGSGFYLSSENVADVTYEADLRLESAAAAGITFRADTTASRHYTAEISADAGGRVRLWRPGKDLATYGTPIARHRAYHLRVVTAGSSIKVYVGDKATPVIDVVDSTYTGGLLGLHVSRGAAKLSNANGMFTTDLTGPWHATTSVWTDTARGKLGWANGDGFYMSGHSAADLTYEADLTLDRAVAASLTFRATADLTQHYTANINTSGGGQIKLWRPGRDLATYSTPIAAGQPYHLKAVVVGERIRVYLGDGATPVIDVVDTSYNSGLIGLNVFSGTATVQNARATLSPAPASAGRNTAAL